MKYAIIAFVTLFLTLGLARLTYKGNPYMNQLYGPHYTQRVQLPPFPQPTPALYASPGERQQGPIKPPVEIADQNGDTMGQHIIEQAGQAPVSVKELTQVIAEINAKLPLETVASTGPRERPRIPRPPIYMSKYWARSYDGREADME